MPGGKPDFTHILALKTLHLPTQLFILYGMIALLLRLELIAFRMRQKYLGEMTSNLTSDFKFRSFLKN